MLPILKKELRTYFSSLLAYVVIAVFLVLTGFVFAASVINFSNVSMQYMQMGQKLNFNEIIMRGILKNIAFILLITIPVLTMRVFAEEKKMGTIELLFTYPLKEAQLVFGKWLGGAAVIVVMIALTLTYPLLVMKQVPMEWGMILLGYLGVLLTALAFLSLGLWASSLTDNQVIAFITAFGALLFFWILSWTSQLGGGPVNEFLSQLSLMTHLDNFTKGVLDTFDCFYYLAFIGFFLTATYFSLESRKWKG
jgi:ABC-2 type transport system permease protein